MAWCWQQNIRQSRRKSRLKQCFNFSTKTWLLITFLVFFCGLYALLFVQSIKFNLRKQMVVLKGKLSPSYDFTENSEEQEVSQENNEASTNLHQKTVSLEILSTSYATESLVNPLDPYFNTTVNFTTDISNFRWPSLNKLPVNCKKLAKGDKKEMQKAKRIMTGSYRGQCNPPDYYNKISCTEYIPRMGYITSPVTAEEAEFPIAFSMLLLSYFIV